MKKKSQQPTAVTVNLASKSTEANSSASETVNPPRSTEGFETLIRYEAC